MSLEKDYYDAQVRIAALEKLVSKAEAENVALRAKVARLEAPVSDVEWYDAVMVGNTLLAHVDALIAARGREGE